MEIDANESFMSVLSAMKFAANVNFSVMGHVTGWAGTRSSSGPAMAHLDFGRMPWARAAAARGSSDRLVTVDSGLCLCLANRHQYGQLW